MNKSAVIRSWVGRPDERYWLEITDSGDLGVDPNATQLKGAAGRGRARQLRDVRCPTRRRPPTPTVSRMSERSPVY